MTGTGTEVRDAIAGAMGDDLSGFYVTGAALMAEPEPPPPPLSMFMDEGGAVLREGRRYLFVGQAGIGKSLLAQGAVIEAAHAGRSCVFFDWEETDRTFKVRRKALRVGPSEHAATDDDANRIFYRCTVGETLPRDLPLPDACGLVVFDSLSRAMGAYDLDENSAADLNRFVADVIDPLWRRVPDAALVLLDHPGHADATRGRGSSAKRPAVDVDLTVEPVGRGLRLVKRKDRHADYPTVPVGGTVAEVRVHADGNGTAAIHYREAVTTYAADGRWRPDVMMERASQFLEAQADAVSKTAVENGVEGKREAVRRALAVLEAEGFVATEHGPRRAVMYRSVRLYRRALDPALHDARPRPDSWGVVASERGAT